MSSFVNEAYKTLLNPFSRAEYILRLEGIEIGESDNLQDKELIMEIMELREALEDAEHQDAVDEIRAENAGALYFYNCANVVRQCLRKRYIDNMKSVIDQISTYVEGCNWDAVKSHAIKLKYMQSIDAAAEAWPNTVHDH
jgi:DnaJ-domain-containing protein 1